MVILTGEVTAKIGDKIYTLHLTMRGNALLQAEFGKDFVKLLETADDALPPLDLCLRIVELALAKRHAEEDVEQVADLLLSDDLGLVGRIIRASFKIDEGVQVKTTGGKKQKAAAV